MIVQNFRRSKARINFHSERLCLGRKIFTDETERADEAAMIAAALFGAFLWWRGTLFETRWYLRVMAHSWWVGFVGVIAGWIVTECGRQPWIVHGILRTADATSPVPGATIAGTLALFVLAYGVVFWFGIYYINRLIAQGPQLIAAEPGYFSPSPISAAQHAGREAMKR